MGTTNDAVAVTANGDLRIAQAVAAGTADATLAAVGAEASILSGSTGSVSSPSILLKANKMDLGLATLSAGSGHRPARAAGQHASGEPGRGREPRRRSSASPMRNSTRSPRAQCASAPRTAAPSA